MLQIVTAGNGIALTDVDFESNEITIGDSDHFVQMFDIKEIDRSTTTQNAMTKNALEAINLINRISN